MESVCEELDSVLLELMACLEELQVARGKYDNAVSEGYFCMAKARYSMPPQSVSSLQYDSVMTPLVYAADTPHCSSYDDITVSKEGKVDAAFSVQRTEESGSQTSGSTTDTPQLRQRATAAAADGVEELSSKMEGLVVGEKPKDPLTMFGVLVPQCLRLSQQYFVQAVFLSGEMANSQVRLETLRRRYRQLMAEKLNLQSKTA